MNWTDCTGSRNLQSYELPYLSTLVSLQASDERDLGSSSVRNTMRDCFAHYMVNMFVYEYKDGNGISGCTQHKWYRALGKYRLLGMNGNDATGARPIPMSCFYQCFIHEGNWNIGLSELSVSQYAPLLFGYKHTIAFFYNDLDMEVQNLEEQIFDSDGDTQPNNWFYRAATNNMRIKNLASALVRLLSTLGYSFPASQWQISPNINFSTTITLDSGETIARDCFTPPANAIPSGTYYWRCRYKNSVGIWSDWSLSPTSFQLTLPTQTGTSFDNGDDLGTFGAQTGGKMIENYFLQGFVSPPAGATLGQWNQNWSVGRGMWDGSPTDFIDGIIDEVRISNRALDPDQFLAVDDITIPFVNLTNNNVNVITVSGTNIYGANSGDSVVITKPIPEPAVLVIFGLFAFAFFKK